MIKIKMLTCAAGPLAVRPIGWIGEAEDKEARALIAGGFAVAVKPPASTAISPEKPQAIRPGGEKRIKK